MRHIYPAARLLLRATTAYQVQILVVNFLKIVFMIILTPPFDAVGYAESNGAARICILIVYQKLFNILVGNFVKYLIFPFIGNNLFVHVRGCKFRILQNNYSSMLLCKSCRRCERLYMLLSWIITAFTKFPTSKLKQY